MANFKKKKIEFEPGLLCCPLRISGLSEDGPEKNASDRSEPRLMTSDTGNLLSWSTAEFEYFRSFLFLVFLLVHIRKSLFFYYVFLFWS